MFEKFILDDNKMEVADGKVILPYMSLIDVKAEMAILVLQIQKNFCEEIQKLEGGKIFIVNKQETLEGAKSTTLVLEEGEIFEKVAVCTSVAVGCLSTSAFILLNDKQGSENVPVNRTYFTSGISGVAYPKNPNIPTLNFNYRYFEIKNGDDNIWWFGGGSDLTPYILNIEDCRHFHKVLKICCDKYNEHYYKTFKRSCDDYFYLEHRGERRGIGGIFFSNLNLPDKKTCFEFISACMRSIIPSYMPIVMKNREKKYSAADKQWQLIQRGRYVEFCFICDKATNFALMTPGVQYENILICIPPLAKWQYNYIPDEKSKESELINVLRNPTEWV